MDNKEKALEMYKEFEKRREEEKKAEILKKKEVEQYVRSRRRFIRR